MFKEMSVSLFFGERREQCASCREAAGDIIIYKY